MGASSTAYIGLGSNLGDRAAVFGWAIKRLNSIGAVTAVSPYYETDSIGPIIQPMFLNAVVRLTTTLRPEAVLAALLALELNAGRKRVFRSGPRTLDLDMLLYDDLEISTPDLVVPHPGLHQRAFVLVPLADLCPSMNVPGTNATVAELLRRLEAPNGVYPYSISDAVAIQTLEDAQAVAS